MCSSDLAPPSWIGVDGVEDNLDLLQMASEEDDENAVQMLQTDISQLQELMEQLEFRRMFSGETDENNAFLDIQAGSDCRPFVFVTQSLTANTDGKLTSGV